jgi:hypothetical protein
MAGLPGLHGLGITLPRVLIPNLRLANRWPGHVVVFHHGGRRSKSLLFIFHIDVILGHDRLLIRHDGHDRLTVHGRLTVHDRHDRLTLNWQQRHDGLLLITRFLRLEHVRPRIINQILRNMIKILLV